MSKLSHTPGPWRHVRESGDGKRQFVESDQSKDNWNCLRCEVESDDCNYEMAIANARLIAAAPELLQMAIDWLHHFECDLEYDGEPDDKVPPDILHMRQVIRKATGQ